MNVKVKKRERLNMRNLLRKSIGVAVVFACFILCNYSFAAAKKTTTKAEYTVIVYLNGGDLESKHKTGTWILNTLMNSTFSDSKLNFIVITGGTKKWHLEYPKISPEKVQLWRIWGEPQKSMECFGEYDSSYKMMDKQVLSGCIDDVMAKYPAKKYILIMWDHGGGPNDGFGSDELNDNESMSISNIQWALQNSLKGKKLELIIFDCCLMGNFETAYKLKDCAKYMIGSEDLTIGDCFEGITKVLAGKPSISGKDLGRDCIDFHFKENYKNYKKIDGFYTFSLIDLSKLEAVKNNWDIMIKQLDEKMKVTNKNSASVYRHLAIARAFSESYEEISRISRGITDMSHFAELISLECDINTEKLQKSIKNAVVYNRACDLRPYSNGLSIFFVDCKLEYNLGKNNTFEQYSQSCFSTDYYKFMFNYYNKLFVENPDLIGIIKFVQTKEELPPGAIEDTSPDYYPPNYRVKIGLNDVPLVNQVWFVIGKLEGKEKKFKALSIDKEASIDFEGNISIAVMGKQYCIDNKSIPIYWDNDINSTRNPKAIPLGSFAVRHKGEIKFLVVKESKNKEDASKNLAEIIGMWDSKKFYDNIIPVLSWLEQPPKKGDKINIMYKVDGEYVDGPEVTLNSYTLSKSCLENGEYVGAFHIEDIIGRKIWSYMKAFKINSTLKVTNSKAEGSETPMPRRETL